MSIAQVTREQAVKLIKLGVTYGLPLDAEVMAELRKATTASQRPRELQTLPSRH